MSITELPVHLAVLRESSKYPVSERYATGRIAWELSEKKTTFTLDPGIFVSGHILILAHDLVR